MTSAVVVEKKPAAHYWRAAGFFFKNRFPVILSEAKDLEKVL